MNDEAKLILPRGGVSTRQRAQVAVTVPGQEYSEEQVRIIKATVMPTDATDFEVAQFLTVCATVKLDPFSRQIYAIRRKGKLVPQTSIDGYVTLAQRTGRYGGRSLPEWEPKPGEAQRPDRCTVWVSDTRGGKAPGVALWNEHVPAQDFIWKERPFEQLEKCAFAKALRALFGADAFGGIYVEDEIPQAEETITIPFREKDDGADLTKPGPPVTFKNPEVQAAFDNAHPRDVLQEAAGEPEPTEARVLKTEPLSSDTQQEPPAEGRCVDWELGLKQADTAEAVQRMKVLIAREVKEGVYTEDQVGRLRSAMMGAVERFK
jgi:phage recombination protein Bet